MVRSGTHLIRKDCIINDYFKDSKNPQLERQKYCRKNCGFKCLKGVEYKKKGGEQNGTQS